MIPFETVVCGDVWNIVCDYGPSVFCRQMGMFDVPMWSCCFYFVLMSLGLVLW